MIVVTYIPVINEDAQCSLRASRLQSRGCSRDTKFNDIVGNLALDFYDKTNIKKNAFATCTTCTYTAKVHIETFLLHYSVIFMNKMLKYF